MKRGLVRVLLLTIFISVFTFAPSLTSAENSEGNSTEWRMYGGWLNHTKWFGSEFSPIQGLNNVTYSFSGEPAASSVLNGLAYFTAESGAEGTIYQLNASNVSQLVGSRTLSGRFLIDDIYPIAAGNYVYIVSRNDDTGLIDQLNASNISQLIATTTPVNAPVGGSPVIYGNSIFYQNSFLYQFNLSNVSQIVAQSGILLNDNSVPAIANGFIYVAGSSRIYQLNLSNITQQIANYSASTAGTSSPTIYNGFLYIGANFRLFQLNATNISQQIANYTVGGSTPVSSPAVANGFVYMGGANSNNVYQLNASNVSQLIASHTTGGVVLSSPVIGHGSVYIGSNDNKMYQLNASNISKVIGFYTTGGDIDTAPSLAGDYLYFESEDGKFYQVLARNISDQVDPIMTINSPENTVYDSFDIPVSFDANEEVTCDYVVSTSNSLSGIGIEENSTISEPVTYTLQATCADIAGNIDTASVSFNVSISAEEPEEDSSARSTSSGSGGGTRTLTSYVFLKADEEIHTVLLGANDKYELEISGETHTITLNSFNESRAELIVRSEPKKLSLEKGSEKNIDVDLDGADDLVIVYEGKEKGKAKISITQIQYLTTEERSVESPQEPEKKDHFRIIFEFALVVFSTITVALYYRMRYSKYFKHFHKVR